MNLGPDEQYDKWT